MIAKGSPAAAALLQAVEADGGEEDQPAGDVLIKRGDVEEVHRIAHRAHDEHAGDHVAHLADAAGERHAAKHAGGDDVEFEALRHRRLAARETGREHDARQARDAALQREDDRLQPVGGNTGETRGLGVAAQRERVAPERRALDEKTKHREANQTDPHGRGQARERGITQHEKRILRDADRLAVGDNVAETPHDLHRGKRGDQSVDAGPRDEHAIDQADQQTKTQPGADTERDTACPVHHHGRNNASAGDDRTDREIERAGGETEQHRAGDDPDAGNGEQQALHVHAGEKAVHGERADGEEHREDEQHARAIPENIEAIVAVFHEWKIR